jgi:exodeoxyribonuclease-5
MIGIAILEDAGLGLSPDEVAAAVRRALSVGAIAAIRSTLVPEFSVYESRQDEGTERVSTGIVDAISFNADGSAATVVDWKSDVEPTAKAVAHYERQIRSYLEMTGTPKGLIVFATTGEVHEVNIASD